MTLKYEPFLAESHPFRVPPKARQSKSRKFLIISVKNSEMSHRTVTPELAISMPRHTHLMRGGFAYYLNMKVPKDLKKLLGKELIRKSLRTTDFRSAVKKVRFEAAKMDAFFDTQREKYQPPRSDLHARKELQEWEIQQLVCRFFVALESKSEDWWLSEVRYKRRRPPHDGVTFKGKNP